MTLMYEDRVITLCRMAQSVCLTNIPQAIGLLSEAIRMMREPQTCGVLRETSSEVRPIQAARRTLWEAFKSDPAFAQTYVDNIACVIMDFEKSLDEPNQTHAPLSHARRQQLAEKIFLHVFMEEP